MKLYEALVKLERLHDTTILNLELSLKGPDNHRTSAQWDRYRKAHLDFTKLIRELRDANYG